MRLAVCVVPLLAKLLLPIDGLPALPARFIEFALPLPVTWLFTNDDLLVLPRLAPPFERKAAAPLLPIGALPIAGPLPPCDMPPPEKLFALMFPPVGALIRIPPPPLGALMRMPPPLGALIRIPPPPPPM